MARIKRKVGIRYDAEKGSVVFVEKTGKKENVLRRATYEELLWLIFKKL